MSVTVPESFTKRILKAKKFKGTYQEKRFCKDLSKYKDIVVFKTSDDPNVALDFSLFLDLQSSSSKWVGLTRTDDDGFCIWTDLDDNIPFDDYEFEIKTVRSSDTEVQLKLRIQDGNKSGSKSMSVDGQGFDLSTIKWSDYEPKKLLSSFLGFVMSIQWNWAAIKQSIEFVGVSIIYLVTEIPNMIRFVGEFVLPIQQPVTHNQPGSIDHLLNSTPIQPAPLPHTPVGSSLAIIPGMIPTHHHSQGYVKGW